MSHTMPLPVETQESGTLVPAYCEVCGEEETGLRACDDLPIGYRYRLFKVFAGTCEQCRDRRSVRQRGGPADSH
jgi:hypothetical protein